MRHSKRRRKRKTMEPGLDTQQASLPLSHLGLAAVALIFILFCLGSWHASQPGQRLRPSPGTKQVQLNWVSPSKEETIKLVRRALELQDPSQIPEFFHMEPRDADQAIELLQFIRAEMGERMMLTWVGDIGRGAQAMSGVLVSPGTRSSKLRLAILTPDPRGHWKLDFDALACTSTPSWAEIIEDGVEEATARVVFRPDHYHNGPYHEQQWACYLLTSPNSDIALFGYTRRGSAAERALQKILSRGKDPSGEPSTPGSPGHRAILRLKKSPDAIARQYEITDVLASDWVMGDQPYDHRFLSQEGPGTVKPTP